tara:strand:+ start:17187 stop:17450 length:264 start_codon:yes stop_codon:yes gene_type:complete
MIKALKVLLSGFYILAVVSIFFPLLGELTLYYQYFIIAVLIAHVFEVLVFIEHIKKYPGAISTSIFLTILYGFLHWLPLKKQAQGEL